MTFGEIRWWQVLVAAAVLTLAVGGLVPVVKDEPATPTAEEATREIGWAGNEELWRRQSLLSDLRTWIAEQPGIESSGYIESVNNPAAGSTILLWRGPATLLQQQIKDKGREMGIPVTVEQRKYSLADLMRAQQAVEDLGPLDDFKVNSTSGLTADFDGITVYGDFLRPHPDLARELTARIGVAVEIKPGGEIVPA